MRRELYLRIALVAGVLGLCVAGFFACFEKREVEIESPLSAEARRNRHLALGRLLERMGHTVEVHESYDRLGALPAPPATVFLTSNRMTLGEQRSEELLRWVARGGHLVVVTYTVWENDPQEGERLVSSRPDWLLDRFGLRQRQARPAEREDGFALDAAAEASEAEAATPDEEAQPASERSRAPDESLPEQPAKPTLDTSWAQLEEGEASLELGFSPHFWWDDTAGAAVWSVAGDAGAHLVEVEHGAGRISALTSDELLVNETIGARDHAEFLVRWLRDGREGRAPIWIFVGERWPSFFTLLRRVAWPTLAAGALLLSWWLWRSLWRFGPALPAPPLARRRWLEHLEAAGHFHWRQDRGATLLAALRAELAKELARKRPGWVRLPERERTERLAHASGLASAEIALALFDSARAPKTFIAAVRALERVRAAL